MTHVLDVPPGAVLPGRLQAITRIEAESPKDAIMVEIPGEILRAGDSTMLRVLPYSILGLEGEEVLLTASVAAHAKLESELERLESSLKKQKLDVFAIRVTAPKTKVADLLNLASESGGCGCQGSRKTLVGQIEVGVSGRKAEVQWTKPVRARLSATAIDSDAPVPGGIIGWHIFDCHSVWSREWRNGRNRTDCKGPCPAPDKCLCEQRAGWFRKTCIGWITCWCV